jgi:hypothetical protein
MFHAGALPINRKSKIGHATDARVQHTFEWPLEVVSGMAGIKR